MSDDVQAAIDAVADAIARKASPDLTPGELVELAGAASTLRFGPQGADSRIENDYRYSADIHNTNHDARRERRTGFGEVPES